MDAAWQSGINWFDTADAYGGGRSELAIQNGFSLLARDGERDVLPLCAERDVAYLAFSPLGGEDRAAAQRALDRFAC